MIRAVLTLIIFGEIYFLLVSENEFAYVIHCNGKTSFMAFFNVLTHLLPGEWTSVK